MSGGNSIISRRTESWGWGWGVLFDLRGEIGSWKGLWDTLGTFTMFRGFGSLREGRLSKKGNTE